VPLDVDTAYMAGRVESYQAALLKSVEDAARTDLLAQYESLNTEVTDELARLFGKHATDGKLTLTEMHRYGKLRKLNAWIADLARDLGGTEEAFLRTQLGALYEANAVGLSNALGIAFSGVDEARMTASVLYPWSGADFSERVWANADKLTATLRQTLTRGFAQGDSFARMNAAVMKATDASVFNARRLIRTEAMFQMNASSMDQYRKYGAERVQCLETWDERTCNQCAPLDGKEYAIDDAPTLPRHAC